MKCILILVAGLAACAARAQSTNAPPQHAEPLFPTENALRAQVTLPYQNALKPNETKMGHLTLSGIGIELARAKNPLQLINPAAPPEYGYAGDNIVRDPITGRASGLKVFAIQF